MDYNAALIQGASTQPSNFYVVGIGASAGGIAALQSFFRNMPDNNGMAFVVVMHLSPDHESSLKNIIQSQTGMQVIQITEMIEIAPNNVYVIPNNMHLLMQNNKINLIPPQQTSGRRIAIDLFFRSLSVSYREKAICIVLSGTDCDGEIGLKHIKEQGGITIAQDPTEAEFSSMPTEAISTGMVDWVLPAGDIPGRLLHLIQNEPKIHLSTENNSFTDSSIQTASGIPDLSLNISSPSDEATISEILRILRAQTGHDFNNYKRATVLRRITRRLQVNLQEDLSSYLEFLHTHPSETNALKQDLLISVTNFFRDRDAFSTLQTYIPQFFADKQASSQVRVWVPGCATGEEAYSVAILLAEYAAKLDNPPSIQILATDLSEDVIRTARTGIYPSSIEADVSSSRLHQFFHKVQGRYQVDKNIREMVLFSPHDLLKDAPFSRLDLVTCRNLLIYLRPDAQKRVFDLFHFALKPGGILFLGSSEHIDDANLLFAPIDKRHRIYVRRSTASSTVKNFRTSQFLLSQEKATANSEQSISQGEDESDNNQNLPPRERSGKDFLIPLKKENRAKILQSLHMELLEKYSPPSLIIDDNYNILHLSPTVNRYLQFSGGEVTSNLTRIIHPSLRLEVGSALYRCSQNAEDILVQGVTYSESEVEETLDIQFRYVNRKGSQEAVILVIFLPSGSQDTDPEMVTNRFSLQEGLSEEMFNLKEQLTLTVEQYEAALDDLTSSNEELQAMNEELHSASEELETSSEELQSMNEELITLNHELKNNIEELGTANSDLQNLMMSTEIGTIFLDRQMRIKRYTSQVQEIFNVIPSDIGRPLSDITNKLSSYPFIEDAQEVLKSLRMKESEVNNNNKWFLVRVLPYRTMDDHIDGVVLTFIDITSQKNALEAQKRSEARFKLIVDQATTGILQVSINGAIELYNESYGKICGYDLSELLNKDFTGFIHPEEKEEEINRFQEMLKSGTPYESEFRILHKDGRWIWIHSNFSVILDSSGSPSTSLAMVSDITERKQADDLLRDSEERLRRAVQIESVGMLFFDANGKITEANEAFLKMSGYSAQDIRDGQVTRDKLIAPEWVEHSLTAIGEFKTGGTSSTYEKEYIRKDGTRWWALFTAASVSEKEAVEYVLDITERKQFEEELQLSERRSRLTVEQLHSYALITLDNEGKIISMNEGARALFRCDSNEMLGRNYIDCYDRKDYPEENSLITILSGASNGRVEEEGWRIRNDKSRFWSYEVTTSISVPGSTPMGYVKICSDMTNKRMVEEQRNEITRETTILSERNRMAQELHDTLAQAFIAIKLQMDTAENLLQKGIGSSESLMPLVLLTREMALQSLTEARATIHGLRSPLLSAEGLVESIKYLVALPANQTPVYFNILGTPLSVSSFVEDAIYRICQEGLTNAHRHSSARAIHITLSYSENTVELSIKDDGIGFSLNSVQEGFGILGMQERARKIDADLNFISSKGNGTEVKLKAAIPQLENIL